MRDKGGVIFVSTITRLWPFKGSAGQGRIGVTKGVEEGGE